MACNDCKNPVASGLRSTGDLTINPNFAQITNDGALAKTAINAPLYISQNRLLKNSKGSNLTGGVLADDHRNRPNQLSLIIDTTANGTQTVLDYPIFDMLDFYKEYNTTRQATAAVGTVYGRSGAAAEQTKVSLSYEGNTKGYTNLMKQWCNSDVLLEAMSLRIYNSSGVEVSLRTPMQAVAFNSDFDLNVIKRFDPAKWKDCTTQIGVAAELSEDVRMLSGNNLFVLSSLLPGYKYELDFTVSGYGR